MTSSEASPAESQAVEIAEDYRQIMSEEESLDGFFVIEDLSIRVEDEEFSEEIGRQVLELLDIDIQMVEI